MRLFVDTPLQPGTETALPESADRHARVRRVQPGDTLVLLDGHGAEWPATVLQVGRSQIRVHLGEPQRVSRELPLPVTLAVVVPANERMDWLVEKATELGVASLQPVLAERSVLRLKGERADKKRAHWQGIAVAACEQCGRNRVPVVHEAVALQAWLAAAAAPGQRLVLSLATAARALSEAAAGLGPVTLLSGPEGGLSPAEEQAALAAGFVPVNLGPRVLRAETAPLAALAALILL